MGDRLSEILTGDPETKGPEPGDRQKGSETGVCPVSGGVTDYGGGRGGRGVRTKRTLVVLRVGPGEFNTVTNRMTFEKTKNQKFYQTK